VEHTAAASPAEAARNHARLAYIAAILVALAVGGIAVALLIARTDGSAKSLPRSGADVAAARRQLARLIWPDGALPAGRPVEAGDRLRMRLPDGFVSTARIFRPSHPNGRALIWHNGHQGTAAGIPVAKHAAARGYLVVLMDMPMFGANSRFPKTLPDGSRLTNVAVEACGGWPLQLGSHEAFACFDHPLQVFNTPVIEVVSWLVDRGYDVAMGGLSGGGWTTAVAAAVDPRIRLSIPVAGTEPGLEHFCDHGRPSSRCVFDFEQREIFRAAADYDTLYALGAAGARRGQTAIYNLHDPCCYQVDRATWAPAVRNAVRSIGAGGRYAAFVDRRNRVHSVSPAAMRWLFAALAR
jgi:hypothetical protein